jgi:hypothetical protein
MHSDVRLRVPITLSGDDVEEALFEQTLDEASVARVFGRLRGAAERAADELNRALKVDILEMLAQGWSQVPAVRIAVERSAVTQGPPAIINLDRHTIASTARVVLDTHVAQSALPPLHLSLEIAADVQSATLAARAGRIELVALGEAAVVARLRYQGMLVKEHATNVAGAPRDPFKRRPSVVNQASVDIQI